MAGNQYQTPPFTKKNIGAVTPILQLSEGPITPSSSVSPMPYLTPHGKRDENLRPNILDRNFANDANELLKEKSREIVALGTEYQKSKDDMSMAIKTLQTKIEKLESENSQLQSTVYKLQDKNLTMETYLNKLPTVQEVEGLKLELQVTNNRNRSLEKQSQNLISEKDDMSEKFVRQTNELHQTLSKLGV